MKSVILLTVGGLFQPRYYMQALALKRRYLVGLAFISILMYMVGNIFYITPLTQQISSDLTTVTKYIPNYTMDNHQLTLQVPAQPVYYKSTFVQFVIDDTLHTASTSANLEKLEQLDSDIPLLVLLGKSNGVLRVEQHYMPFDSVHLANVSSEDLKAMFLNMAKVVPIATFVSTFLLSTFQYAVYIAIIAMFAAFFNRHLSQPFSFKMRLRIVILTAFIPTILLNLLGLVFPLVASSPIPLAIMTLYSIFTMLMQHTQFIKDTHSKQEEN